MREGKKWLVYFPSENQKPDLDLPTILEMSAKSKKSKGSKGSKESKESKESKGSNEGKGSILVLPRPIVVWTVCLSLVYE